MIWIDPYQLISAISNNLLDPRLEADRIQEFRKQLESRFALEERLPAEGVSNRSNLEVERLDLEKRARHLADAIAQHGSSPFYHHHSPNTNRASLKLNDF
jgi:hypothetical protein